VRSCIKKYPVNINQMQTDPKLRPVTEVIPGIYQLQLRLPNIYLEHANTYLVRGDHECLLVDSGWDLPPVFDSLEKQLKEIGAGFKDISRIVITHVHPDHYGLAGRLKRLCHAELTMHLLERDIIELRYVHTESLRQQLSMMFRENGVPDDELPQFQTSAGMIKLDNPALPDVILRGGETISISPFNFEVLWTPGHSPGHICLYEPAKKLLISGDHVLPTTSPHVGLSPYSSRDPMDDYISSLRALRHLDAKIVLPGHENPFTGLKERLLELVHHHEERDLEIIERLTAGAMTGYQVAVGITWMPATGGVSWEKLPSEFKRFAMFETLAYLEALRFSNKVSQFLKEGITYYQRV
jgi:glyoxylase-like metal-dependent hydrolase (beta-lactamase superfamily II)